MWRPRLLKDEVEVRAHADTITIKLVVDRMVHSCVPHTEPLRVTTTTCVTSVASTLHHSDPSSDAKKLSAMLRTCVDEHH
jgi:hypothetical protein